MIDCEAHFQAMFDAHLQIQVQLVNENFQTEVVQQMNLIVLSLHWLQKSESLVQHCHFEADFQCLEKKKKEKRELEVSEERKFTRQPQNSL